MNNSKAETILYDLVAIPSITNDREANNQVLNYVDKFLSERGMHIERRVHDGYGALVATTTPTKTPEIMFVAHADVVSATGNLFHVREDDGKLFGRGVLDMKSAIASYLALTDELSGNLHEYDYGIEIVTNEEIGGLGVKNLLEEGFIPQVAILLDGGRDWQIETIAKGAWTVKVVVNGKPAHGSHPWEGESASFRLLDLLGEVRALFKDQNLNTDTLNISLLSGGNAQNQVPASAEATLDIRVMSHASYVKIKNQVVAICKQYGVVPKIIAFFAPLEHDMANPYITRFAKSIETVTGVSNKGVVSSGTSDAVYYNARSMPCVVTRPTGGDAHGEHEWIDKQAFNQLVPVLRHYITHAASLRPSNFESS